MAGITDRLIKALLYDDFTQTHNPSAGTTAVISITGVKYGRHTITSLLCSAENLTASDFTATLSVRDASIGGAIRAQHQMLVHSQDYDGLSHQCYMSGLNDNALVVEFGTPNASVIQKITVCGFTDGLRSSG